MIGLLFHRITILQCRCLKLKLSRAWSHRQCECLKLKLPRAWGHDLLHLTLVSVVIEIRLYVEFSTTSRGCSTIFEIEVGCLSSLLQFCHKRFCNFRMLIQTCIQFLTFVRIQIYNFFLSIFGHGVIFGITSKYSKPFCEARCLPPL